MRNEILLFDIQEIEKEFFEKNTIEGYNYIYLENSLNSLMSGLENHKDVEIISVFTSSRVDKSVIDSFPNLKLIATRSVGTSHIDVDYCEQKGIKIENAPNYGDCTVAEFTFGLILNITRNIAKAYSDLQKGVINHEPLRGIELFNKTIGIIGLGAIGTEVARIANGFSMNILGYDLYERKNLVEKYDVKYTTLEDLCAKSDIITIHAPSTKDNLHLLNAKMFDLMKDSAYLINTARGEIVDTMALYEALLNKKLAGAAMDVVECEDILSGGAEYISKIDCIRIECLKKTLINHKLLQLDNVIITPHIAYSTSEAIERILQLTLQNFKQACL